MIKYKEIREQVLNAALRSNELGLIHGTSGNISVRDKEDNVVAITPSNIAYETMKVEDIAIVDINGKWIDGNFKPSSETPMHTAVLRRRDDINAVVHTHSKYATVMSMRCKQLPRATVPSNMYYPIVCTTEFFPPGSERLAQTAVDAIGMDNDVTLLKNHGLLATGCDIDSAMTCAIYTEECAEISYLASIVGFDDFISEEDALYIRNIAKGGNAV
ncbi:MULTISPECIES: class II aldolase/adducin family protein [Anaerofustis]|uniref:class II aldolase/adducin family protein n=1 Tax=Anaerofustis TaxID=264995 RepID=UPI001A9BDAF6|nr:MULTISPECIES: class II aldolase/adducin family protein [Anaerofustis]MCO8193280.1 class II aldolase/adducin family protein [Anaerofustis sp. NSJ-163]